MTLGNLRVLLGQGLLLRGTDTVLDLFPYKIIFGDVKQPNEDWNFIFFFWGWFRTSLHLQPESFVTQSNLISRVFSFHRNSSLDLTFGIPVAWRRSLMERERHLWILLLNRGIGICFITALHFYNYKPGRLEHWKHSMLYRTKSSRTRVVG